MAHEDDRLAGRLVLGNRLSSRTSPLSPCPPSSLLCLPRPWPTLASPPSSSLFLPSPPLSRSRYVFFVGIATPPTHLPRSCPLGSPSTASLFKQMARCALPQLPEARACSSFPDTRHPDWARGPYRSPNAEVHQHDHWPLRQPPPRRLFLRPAQRHHLRGLTQGQREADRLPPRRRQGL